jgi:hypothetical protein
MWIDGNGDCYVFSKDGSFSFTGIDAAEGTYTLSGSKITIELADFATDIVADCSFIDSNTLVIENPESSSGEVGVPTTLFRVNNTKHVGAQQFYAHVIQGYDKFLRVKGIPGNDINHRGEFDVSFSDQRNYNVLDASGKPINFVDIPEGSLVLVVYRGSVLERYPGVIADAVSIRIQAQNTAITTITAY